MIFMLHIEWLRRIYHERKLLLQVLHFNDEARMRWVNMRWRVLDTRVGSGGNCAGHGLMQPTPCCFSFGCIVLLLFHSLFQCLCMYCGVNYEHDSSALSFFHPRYVFCMLWFNSLRVLCNTVVFMPGYADNFVQSIKFLGQIRLRYCTPTMGCKSFAW